MLNIKSRRACFAGHLRPGSVYQNLLRLPLRVGERPAPAAPGRLRAYELRAGQGAKPLLVAGNLVS